MALFEPPSSRQREEFLGTDAATRALSVTVVENDFVERVYENIAWAYDAFFGPTLHPGRVQAIQRMGIGPRAIACSKSAWAPASTPRLYPRDCSVTGIDLSGSMLEKARERIARKGIRNVRLLEMDAADLKFADDTFDIVYAPYRHQRRSRPGGRRPRDAARLPAGRPHHRPQSLPQRQPRARLASSAPSRPSPCTSVSSRISICRRFSRRPISTPCRSRR